MRIACLNGGCLIAYLLCLGLVQAQNSSPLFELIPARQTGLNFTNQLTESDSLNILNQANIYNGSGIGIADFNNDGLPDVYVAGNMVPNKLYLNKGNLRFDDITTAAGVHGEGRWCTGVSVVDINNDGWQDIYVSASFRKNPVQRTNLFYINQGLSSKGIPVFKEMAEEYGLADTGFSTQAYFFDYDRDGDLDCYLVTNELYDPKTPIRFRPKLTDGTANNTDRLFRNEGNNHFANVSREAGITMEGWGHAACITDINQDGWPDIYVANDFVSNDLLYINNRDGSFTNQLTSYFKHTGWNAMGTDFADLNNDGLQDLVSLEMLPEDNLRKKRMLAGNEYYNYYNSQRFGYSHQYVRNVVQLNKGRTEQGNMIFSDIAYQLQMEATDWSWCPLIADFDNNGLRDVVITNGLPRDVTDLDYITFKSNQSSHSGPYKLAQVASLPIVKLSNYAYANHADSGFRKRSASWGFTHTSFSTGAAYADLDMDGDLDILINNLNDPLFLYKNTYAEKNSSRNATVRIKLTGPANNKSAFGASVRLLLRDGAVLFYEHQPARGYLSSVEPIAHFAISPTAKIESVQVIWPDGKTSNSNIIPLNKLITFDYQQADGNITTRTTNMSSLLKRQNAIMPFVHRERDAIDYNFQASLPHKLSQFGPGLAVSDLNGDGLEDLVVGASVGNSNVFFFQQKDGSFRIDSTRLNFSDKHPGEDMGLLFFDADNDGDPDLYKVSGSYELAPGAPASQDLLYFNDGKGNFELRKSALPVLTGNGSVVRAADFDGDGLLDLFVGGRSVSSAYPSSPRSYLLKNYGGTFIDVTKSFCPDLVTPGMVSDALFTDFNNDQKTDLILACEWMPLQFFKRTANGFVNISTETGLEAYSGWWNSLTAGDFDKDGDIDYVAGNLGLNSGYRAGIEEPMFLYAGDFDENGLLDPLIFCYNIGADGKRSLYPMTTRDDMISQLLPIRKKFPTYESYGNADLNQFLTEEQRNNATILKATYMQSSYIENLGNGKFRLKALPAAAQEAPVFGMLADDVDADGELDLLLVGNDFGMEPYSGRHDAFNGLYLKGDGAGEFKPLNLAGSGFYVPGDAKALVRINRKDSAPLYIASQNQDSLCVFNATKSTPAFLFIPEKNDAWIEIEEAGAKKRKIELYYGSTFLSQSSRAVNISPSATKITVTNYQGQSRTPDLPEKRIQRNQ